MSEFINFKTQTANVFIILDHGEIDIVNGMKLKVEEKKRYWCGAANRNGY